MLTETKKRLTSAEASTLSSSYRRFLDELATRLKPAWRINDKRVPLFTWRTFAPADSCSLTQGWKIHISAAAVEAMDLCEVVANLLVEHPATFKLPSALDNVRSQSRECSCRLRLCHGRDRDLP